MITEEFYLLRHGGYNENRQVVHLDLDSFFVSVERLLNSSLNNQAIIIGGTSNRGVVSSCSYEARKYGVSSGMPIRTAKELCPNAIFIRGDYEQYTKYSNLVTEIISHSAPVFEKASIDEHYIDVSGMDKFFGCLKWTQELRTKIIKESGLPISFGLSVNKTVSKIATTEGKPNGELFVPKPQVQTFLWPLSIKKIPMIGTKTFQTLRSMGIATIKTLSEIPLEMMQNVLGENGKSLWLKANGIDQSPVEPYSERKSLSSETTFEKDSTDVLMMERILIKLTEELCYKMRQEEKLTSCITVKIRYSNFETFTMQKRIAYTAFDHTIIDVSKELFKKLYNRRLLIRLIGIRFSHLVQGLQQINMFEDTQERVQLYQALDKIRNRFGEKSIGRA
ncbi:MAG: DNA polymerase IV [Bacteroidota bacterium]|jgi:DNA polymerase-4